MTPVVLLAHDTRRVLGLPLWRHAELAAERAGLRLGDAPPAGEAIFVAPGAVVTSDALRAVLAAPRPEGGAVADEWGCLWRCDVTRPRGGPIVRVRTNALHVRTHADARRAGRLLARDACKRLAPGDFFGVLNRELTLPLARLAAAARLSPNAISIAGLLVTLASLVPLARGSYGWMLLGALLQWAGSLLDGVDGKVARLCGRHSALGSWLDHIVDNFVYYPGLFVALGLAAARSLPAAVATGLGAFAVANVAVTALIVSRMRLELAPPDDPGALGRNAYALIFDPRGGPRRADPLLDFARATWRLTTRAGLPHLVLVAGLLGVLPAFFVGAAIGTVLVWPVALHVRRLLMAGRAEVARA